MAAGDPAPRRVVAHLLPGERPGRGAPPRHQCLCLRGDRSVALLPRRPGTRVSWRICGPRSSAPSTSSSAGSGPAASWCGPSTPTGHRGAMGCSTGSSSAYFSLRCAIACAAQLGHEHPDWELAAGRLRHAIAHDRTRLRLQGRVRDGLVLPGAGGRARRETASERIEERWSEFVIEQRGVRCVSDRPVGDRRGDRRVRHRPGCGRAP